LHAENCEKHGIKQAGFRSMLIGDGNHDLHYLLAWDSLADREKEWNVFQTDPGVAQSRDDSERADRPLQAHFCGQPRFRRFSEGQASIAAANGFGRGTAVRVAG
jgi:hypothetical protein